MNQVEQERINYVQLRKPQSATAEKEKKKHKQYPLTRKKKKITKMSKPFSIVILNITGLNSTITSCNQAD